MRRPINLLYILILLLSSGCGEQSATNNSKNENVEDLKNRISELETEIFILKINQEKFNTATFDPASGKGYQRIDTASGTFLISVQEVRPYLDGVRVVLHIGNTQFASYNGFKIKAEYSKRYPKYETSDTTEERKSKIDAHTKSKREKEENFTKVLRPAAWNVVTLTLPDIKPSDFGYLNISMTTNSISMTVN